VIVCNKIFKLQNLNDTYFVDEVETQLRENHSGAAKTRISTIHKTKLVTKAVALTYPNVVVVP
jgi:hypothetical protein